MIKEPKCWTRGCKHFLGVIQLNRSEDGEKVTCEAFPQGIPFEIAYGDDSHYEPIPGQENDIVFEED